MGFKSYSGTARLGAGLIPAAEGYPLMQSCDIQVAEDGTRLDEALNMIVTEFATIQKLVPITQADYKALVDAGTTEKDTVYLIIDEDSV